MNTISPLDNRYHNKISDVIEHFDIFNFTKYKLLVECEYFNFLTKIIDNENTNTDRVILSNLLITFNKQEFQKIVDFEKISNHDIQALIDYLKTKNFIKQY